MSLRHPFVSVLAIIVLATILGGLLRAARRTATMLHASDATAGILDEQIQTLRKQIAAKREKNAELVKNLKTKPKSASVTGIEGAAARFYRMLNGNSELLAAWNTQEKTRLRLQYGALIRRLGLSADQADQFLRLLVEDENRTNDLNALAQAENLSSADRGSLRQAQAIDLESEERALLGDNGLQQLKDLGRTQDPERLLTSLFATLVFTAPLSIEQGDRMIQAFETDSAQYQHGGTVDLATVDWTAVSNRAQNILSPEQYAAFTATIPGYRYVAEFQAAEKAAIEADAGKNGTP
jgi:hypothetical protein